jgi:hypothetical protein
MEVTKKSVTPASPILRRVRDVRFCLEMTGIGLRWIEEYGQFVDNRVESGIVKEFRAPALGPRKEYFESRRSNSVRGSGYESAGWRHHEYSM